MKNIRTFLCFKKGKLVTVVETIISDFEEATNNMDLVIADPQDAEKQITEWKKSHETT